MKPIHSKVSDPFGVKLFFVGVVAAWSAQYLRVWPYPHWVLNVVFLIWVIAAIALFLGARAMREANQGLAVPTAPDKLARYRKLTGVSFLGLSVLGLLFAAPWIFEAYRPGPSIQASLILLGWGASMVIIWALHRNRRECTILMSEPAD